MRCDSVVVASTTDNQENWIHPANFAQHETCHHCGVSTLAQVLNSIKGLAPVIWYEVPCKCE